MSQKMQEQKRDFRNYYEVLGLTPDATLRDIEKAYQRLALKWHPDKHTVDRKLAEKKFHEISEAFDVLSDPNKRSTYDQVFHKQESLENAMKTFDRFYGERQMMDEEQQKFFQKNFPEKKKNYYKILGVNRDSSQQQIEKTYRKLALKYHPKNNPGNQQAHKKFVEVNQAYQTLSQQSKRTTYDDLMREQIIPRRAHDIFEDFFNTKWMQFPEQQEFFRPIFDRRSRMLGNVDTMMPTMSPLTSMSSLTSMNPMTSSLSMTPSLIGSSITPDLRNIKQGESFHRQQKVQVKDGRQHRTAETTKRKIHNGVVQQQTIKQNVLPTGQRDVVKTIKKGDKVDTKTYHLKRNQELPRQLKQLNY